MTKCPTYRERVKSREVELEQKVGMFEIEKEKERRKVG